MKAFDFLHKYFGFNKRERNGIIILGGIVVVLVFARVFITPSSKELTIDLKKLEALNSIEKEESSPQNKNEYKKEYSKTNFETKYSVNLFPFDPNTITVEEAKSLGFPEKTANILINFRSKGGKFKTKEDLKKLYGLKEEMYSKLESYILIAPEANASSTLRQAQGSSSAFTPYAKSKPPIIDLNTADSLQLVYLPMIGPGFTKRILKYRNALGGFYKIEQLKEVYGMADSTYNAIKDKITLSPEKVEKINVNVASLAELKSHPYISYNIANSIINYRSKHGLFKNPDDLKEIGTINDATLEKLKAYLSF